MATTGSRLGRAAPLILLAAACGQSASRPAAAAAPSPDVVSTHVVCFAAMPADWARQFQVHTVHLGTAFQLGAAGDAAYGTYRSAEGSGVGAVDLASGALTRIAPLPAGAAGAGAMAVSPPWVVWQEADSAADLGDWTIRAWNRRTGALVDVAGAHLPGGGEVFGQAPLPVVAGGVVAWAQPLARQGDSPRANVQVLDLATRRLTVLDSGRVSGPVFAGPYLAWARVEADGSYTLRAVDAATLRPAALPDRVRTPGPVRYLAGSPGRLVWSTGQDELHAWWIGTHRYAGYTTDLRHPLQFLELAGDFVVWYAGQPSTVLDLATGRAFDVPGSLAGSDALIAESEVERTPAAKPDVVPSRLGYTPLSSATRIAAC